MQNAHKRAKPPMQQLYFERGEIKIIIVAVHNRKMANKKNRKNKKNNSHKHIYQRKKLPRRGGRKGQDKDTQEQHTDNQQHMDTDKLSREGSRIMNIDKLQQYTDNLTKHSIHCESSITLEEVTRAGLASILTGHCSSCEDTIRLETSKKVKGPRGYSRWECNLAAVWGQMATGTRPQPAGGDNGYDGNSSDVQGQFYTN